MFNVAHPLTGVGLTIKSAAPKTFVFVSVAVKGIHPVITALSA